MEKKYPKQFQQDSGWSWVILFSAFFSNFIFDGIIFSFGIFLPVFTEYYQSSHALTSWIGSTISAVYALVGPLASFLAGKFGCKYTTIAGSLLAASGFILSTCCTEVWQLIITYGILSGTGFGLMYLCSYVMIGYYFEKWRAFATGFSSCGSGVGTFVFAPLSNYLIEKFGWRGALLILAGITLQGCVIGMTFRGVPDIPPLADEINKEDNEKKKTMDFKLLLDSIFMIFCFSSFLCAIGFFVPSFYLPDYAKSQGHNKSESAFLLSLLGIFNTLGRIICGVISDQTKIDPLKIYYVALILGGSMTMFVSYMSVYWHLCVYAGVYGLTIAIYVSLCAIIIIDLLGLEKLSNAFGFINMFRGLSTIVGVPTAGALYDFTGNYRFAFYVAGGSIMASGLICIPLRCLSRRIERKKLNDIHKIEVANEETSLLKKKPNEIPSRVTTC